MKLVVVEDISNVKDAEVEIYAKVGSKKADIDYHSFCKSQCCPLAHGEIQCPRRLMA